MTDTEPRTENSPDKSLNTVSNIPLRKQIRARVDELEAQVGNLTTEVEAERDKRLRLAAEYDNYRRRTASEYRHLADTAGERILLKLLPVLDDFDRMMAHADADPVAMRQGSEMIFRKLQSLFDSEGLVAIPSVGKTFDSLLHEAVAQVQVPNSENGTIIAEVERGYRLRDKIIRHSKVIVSQAADQASDTDGAQNG